VTGDLVDVLANMGLVRAYGAQQRERERLERLIAAESRAHARSWMLLERLRAAHDAAFWLASALVLVAAVYEWNRSAITTGGVVVASTLTLRVLMGSRELALSLLGLSQQLGAVVEALAVLQASAENVEATGANPLRLEAGAIELRAVCYAPDGRNLLFSNFHLHIPAGQRIGIVGPSGAGKSTLIRLVQGVVAPGSGEVLLDGQRLANITRESLASAFSVVTQEVALFHRSIAENLFYGRPDASREEMLQVSRAVGCDAFISSLPQGYDTIVGERGVRLSGGQRQRIAIARALLRRAPVLLLDEATSALDSHAESKVQRAILALAGERTVVAVAHRLSTVMEFDRVIVLEDGMIVEDGPPNELRHGTGYFAATWRLQQRSFGAEQCSSSVSVERYQA
jgi:ATP-binding cassette subfamily B protein